MITDQTTGSKPSITFEMIDETSNRIVRVTADSVEEAEAKFDDYISEKYGGDLRAHTT